MDYQANTTPSFRDLYASVAKNGRASLVDSPVLPVCSKCRKAIFAELEHLNYEVNELQHTHIAPNLAFYQSYLLDKNDYDALLCYAHYQEISGGYERSKRAEILDRQTAEGKFTKYIELNIPKRFWGRTPTNRTEIEHQQKMVEVAREYVAEGYQGSLLFASKQRGFGKSDLIVSMLIQYWIDNGGGKTGSFWKDDWSCLNSDILFLNETDLYFMIRSTYSQSSPYTEYDIYKQLSQRVKFLAIDDLFFVGDKTFMRSVLTRLIHKRVDEEMLPILLTSNCTLPMIANIDRSLSSRLSRGKYVSEDPNQKSVDLRTIY